MIYILTADTLITLLCGSCHLKLV